MIYKLCYVFIIIIIIITLLEFNSYCKLINVKKKNLKKHKINKCFYTLDETYPELKSLNNNENFNNIINEVNNVAKTNNWQDWPEYELWDLKKNPKSKWTILPFMAFRKWHNKNINLCPKLYNLLKKLEPKLVNAALSKLGPNTKLDYHYGWGNLSNHVLRCHLGLIIPNNAFVYCRNSEHDKFDNVVKQEVQKWIVFDDSKWHSADNQDTNNDRIVLILDMIRPEHIETGISNVKDSQELINFVNAFNS